MKMFSTLILGFFWAHIKQIFEVEKFRKYDGKRQHLENTLSSFQKESLPKGEGRKHAVSSRLSA